MIDYPSKSPFAPYLFQMHSGIHGPPIATRGPQRTVRLTLISYFIEAQNIRLLIQIAQFRFEFLHKENRFSLSDIFDNFLAIK